MQKSRSSRQRINCQTNNRAHKALSFSVSCLERAAPLKCKTSHSTSAPPCFISASFIYEMLTYSRLFILFGISSWPCTFLFNHLLPACQLHPVSFLIFFFFFALINNKKCAFPSLLSQFCGSCARRFQTYSGLSVCHIWD